MMKSARNPCVRTTNIRTLLSGSRKELRSLRPCLSCQAAPDTAQGDAPASTESDSPENGRQTYKPETYNEMLEDASKAMVRALDAGIDRMEVEFPAVPTTDSYKVASDASIDANTQFALKAAMLLHDATGKRVVVLVPDGPEYERSSKLFRSTLEMSDGVDMGHLFEGREPFGKGLKMLFGMDSENKIPSKLTEADIHIVINVSTNELGDARSYYEEAGKEGSTLVFWNCELDTLRSDLGLFGFPPKEVQYDFLSTFKPVFYLRQRDYSKTVNVAPFIINYSGCLFRDYPGPWQVMLRQDNGEYACIAEDPTRYTLGEVKDELLESMGLKTEEEGSAMEFLRQGYKTSTWWEDDEGLEKSDAWRT